MLITFVSVENLSDTGGDRMTLDQVFSITGTIAMAGWVILAVAPRRWPLLNALPRLVLPAVLSLFYAAYIFAFFFNLSTRQYSGPQAI